MIVNQIAEVQTAIFSVLKEHQVIRAGLFGSLVRGEMRPDSDVDILVQLPLNKSLLDFVGLKLDLENMLGKKVDLVNYSTIHPRLKEQILTEEVTVFMKRDIRLFVQDILDSIIKIEEYTQSFGENDFFENEQTQDAVERRLEIIGEATKNIPRNFRLKYPDIPWPKMAGLRDVIAHGYFGVDLTQIWEVIEQDLPNLKKQMTQILAEME